MMLRMQTLTARKEEPWTTHLGIALAIFALQYLVLFTHIVQLTERFLRGSNGYLWSELFGIPINLFLFSSARMLLNRRNWWPQWFLVLLGLDFAAIVLAIFGLANYESPDLISTLARAIGDVISFITLMHFGYASFINTKVNQLRSGIVLGLLIGIVYGGLHLISPFIPNLAGRFGSQMGDRIVTAFTFFAALFKFALLYSALLITSLESRTVIILRTVLGRCVENREVFFSRQGILKAITDAFQADCVKLYVKVPSKENAWPKLPVHVYSAPSENESEYELQAEADTPLPQLLFELVRQQRYPDRGTNDSREQGLFERIRSLGTRSTFNGTEPIRHHGALIGCLKIEKVGGFRFTHSAERLCRTVAEDISAMVQAYRVQESLRVLIQELKIITTRDIASPDLPAPQLTERLEGAVQQVLSPLRTQLVLDTGFDYSSRYAEGVGAAASDDSEKRVIYPCVTDNIRGGISIGCLYLDYQRKRDPLDRPSLGYFRSYGKAVGSMVAEVFLSIVEQRLNLLVRDLSLELAKRLDFELWYAQIRKTAKQAGLRGCVVYDSEIREFNQLVGSRDDGDDRAIGQALADAYDNPDKLLQDLNRLPKVVLSNERGVVVGIALMVNAGATVRQQGGLFLGIRRREFAGELALATPWRDFLTNFATVAGNARQRIIQAKLIQRNQIQQTEDYMILSAAEKVGLLTHELLNKIENLAANSALLKLDLPDSMDEASKAPIVSRIEEIRQEFEGLRTLTAGLGTSAMVPQQSPPCCLGKTLKKLAALSESMSNIEIRLDGAPNSGTHLGLLSLDDVMVVLPADIVELTFGNLIRNSIAAIKGGTDDGLKSVGTNRPEGLIRIWAERAENGCYDCFVNDNGPGVPPGIRDSIFEVNVSGTPGHAGWGLFYLKRKLSRHSGSIQLQHSEPGNTTFRVGLPGFFNELKKTDVENEADSNC